MIERKPFPKGFFWGAATSAHQIEGGQNNDWTRWERDHAEQRAAQAPKKYGHLENWGHIRDQATDPANYISGDASGSYVHWREDIKLAQEIGLNTYRFSIEWSRVEPQPGIFDEVAIQHYRELIKGLQKAKIRPFVTLFHYTLPVWVADNGGWLNKQTINHFGRYAAKMAAEFPDVEFWTTINEPEVYSDVAYNTGEWPPGHHSFREFFRVLHNLVAGHKRAYRVIKAIAPDVQVGLSTENFYYEAETWLDIPIAAFFTARTNHYILAQLLPHLDFIGINYYFHERIRFGQFNRGGGTIHSDVGLELYPRGLYKVLWQLKIYRKPVYVTESGLADENDSRRPWYLAESIHQVQRAIAAGVDVRGYLHWSLIDNVELDKGFWPKYGLASVDRRTFKRRLRPSARVYAEIIKHNRLPDELPERPRS